MTRPCDSDDDNGGGGGAVEVDEAALNVDEAADATDELSDRGVREEEDEELTMRLLQQNKELAKSKSQNLQLRIETT